MRNNNYFIKLVISLISLVVFVVGCTNPEKTYHKRQTKSLSNSGYRIDLYGNYKKDKIKITNDIKYLQVINDMEYPKNPFKSYNEKEMLEFYKNTSAIGNGDNSNYWRWTISYSKDELNNILNSKLISIYSTKPKDVLTYENDNWISKNMSSNPIGEIIELKIAQRGSGGIATKLIIKGTNGTYLVARELNIRKLLGSTYENNAKLYGTKGGTGQYNSNPLSTNPRTLPSAFLAIEKNKITNGYDIYGGGYGHGSGIPQWTVADLTKNKGYSYKKVLNRYYPKTELKSLKSIKGIEDKVKVGITTTEFGSVNHNKITLYSEGEIQIKTKGRNLNIKPRSNVKFEIKNGSIQIVENGKIRLKTKNKIDINSKKMISIVDIKRNIKKYKYPTYRGKFEIQLAQNRNKLNIINVIDIEEYLLQVVPSEMPQSFGMEALKVQAIAARTYAIKDILKNRYAKQGFHILDSTQSQVYNNLDENNLTKEAVKETKGIIAIYEGKPIDAKYFSTSSGFTEAANNIW